MRQYQKGRSRSGIMDNKGLIWAIVGIVCTLFIQQVFKSSNDTINWAQMQQFQRDQNLITPEQSQYNIRFNNIDNTLSNVNNSLEQINSRLTNIESNRYTAAQAELEIDPIKSALHLNQQRLDRIEARQSDLYSKIMEALNNQNNENNQ